MYHGRTHPFIKRKCRMKHLCLPERTRSTVEDQMLSPFHFLDKIICPYPYCEKIWLTLPFHNRTSCTIPCVPTILHIFSKILTRLEIDNGNVGTFFIEKFLKER